MTSTTRSPRRGPGLSRARRAASVRAFHGATVTREAEELLFAAAEMLTEARVDGARYAGSTMITVDLGELARSLRGLDTAEERARFAALASGSVRLRLRAMRFACAEAARRVPERAFGTFAVDTQVRIDGMRLLIDVDVDAPFAEQGREQRG